jgi:hypothetical protein
VFVPEEKRRRARMAMEQGCVEAGTFVRFLKRILATLIALVNVDETKNHHL